MLIEQINKLHPSAIIIALILPLISGCFEAEKDSPSPESIQLKRLQELQVEIDNHPIREKHHIFAKIRKFENGYLTVEVDGWGRRTHQGFEDGESLQRIAALRNKNVLKLIPIEQTLEKNSDVKDVFWTHIYFEHRLKDPQVRKLISETSILPGQGLGIVKLGDSIQVVRKIIGEPSRWSLIKRDNKDPLHFMSYDFGKWDLRFWSDVWERKIQRIRIAHKDFPPNIARLKSMSNDLPSLKSNVTLGSEKLDAMKKLGDPIKIGRNTVGGCGYPGKSDETIIYNGVWLRFCTEILVDIDIYRAKY